MRTIPIVALAIALMVAIACQNEEGPTQAVAGPDPADASGASGGPEKTATASETEVPEDQDTPGKPGADGPEATLMERT